VRLAHHLTIKNGHLHINGQDCVALAEKYGTPLYVTSEDRVIEQFESYKKALGARYPKVQVLFAAKANGIFGSLERVRGASEEELAAVVGRAGARKVHDGLSDATQSEK
jgi:diaminopimelate decarboxylase